MKPVSRIFSLLIVASALVLGGCATTPRPDAEVQAYSKLAAPVGQAAFRFEVLPSHQDANKRRAEVEAMAERALAKLGLTRNDAKARFSVQVAARVHREDRLDWPDNWHYGWGWYGPRHFSPVRRLGPLWGMPTTPWFQREVSLTLRDLASGEVVYETHARQEGTGGATNAILEALFNAALGEFPSASGALRPVVLHLPDRP